MGHRKHETPQQRSIRRMISEVKDNLREAHKYGSDTTLLEKQLRQLERRLRDASRA